jgi:hypothetical protein
MRTDKNESGIATFTTKTGRPYKIPKNISKPKTPEILKSRMGSNPGTNSGFLWEWPTSKPRSSRDWFYNFQ